MTHTSCVALAGVLALALTTPSSAQLIGNMPDVSEEFQKLEQVYFFANRVVEFDPESGRGELEWTRHRRRPALSFNKLDVGFVRDEPSEFPPTEYDRDPVLPFSMSFVSPKTIRLRFATRSGRMDDHVSMMLDGPPGFSEDWTAKDTVGSTTFTGPNGSVRLDRDPWRIAILDTVGTRLTQTLGFGDPATFSTPIPFSFIRRAKDLTHATAAAFELAHDEMIFGAGESFTRLNKRGQKMILYLRDGMGAQSQRMYKPIPFFMSSRGYGVFVHTSTPVTMDFGHDFDQSNVIYTGDEQIDLFIFLGTPKEILSEYTALTGRSPVPPLWSFGLWMSRITYSSEEEVRSVANELRRRSIPSDVIHIDTGWFETDWRSDFEFSSSRFPNAGDMLADLRQQGFRVSLWQLPYISRKNPLFAKVVASGYSVESEQGGVPAMDAILDFSDPDAVSWYQDKLRGLLRLGVSAIKADFGEDAPLHGVYKSGRTGWIEHNLYPVRYNDVVSEVTLEVTGDHILWGRSAWAGSQRYPVHWGGDAENTNSAMAATLRAGLSLGLSGFTYWSHDIGGFVQRAPRDLYRRWIPFGALTSHTRTHGVPPREPWEYDEQLTDDFRRAMELKYALMPYILAQAKVSSADGHPMLRTLFFEYPDDPTSWYIEDEYMLGTDLLVGPLFEESTGRDMYLPPGVWIDYQTGIHYDGGAWHHIEAGPIPIILLARTPSLIPHAAVAQHTGEIDWTNIELRIFVRPAPYDDAEGWVALPGEEPLRIKVRTDASGAYTLLGYPYAGKVKWTLTSGTWSPAGGGGWSDDR